MNEKNANNATKMNCTGFCKWYAALYVCIIAERQKLMDQSALIFPTTHNSEEKKKQRYGLYTKERHLIEIKSREKKTNESVMHLEFD